MAQQAYAIAPVIPVAGVAIKNTAYATYISPEGKTRNTESNTVQVEVAALYAISLTQPATQEIEAGARVVWLNTLTNTSNTQASINIEKLAASGLSNIKIYIDKNKNGQFDAQDEILSGSIVLDRLQSVNLWVVATAATNLQDQQQLNLPIKAVVVEDSNVTATATDSLMAYLPQLYASKSVDVENFTPGSGKSYELNYTLTLENKGSQAIRPTRIFVDGQAQDMVVMIDALPANTTYKNAQSSNAKALILFKTGDNTFTRQQPSNLKDINEVVVAYPAIEAHSIERVQLSVSMNDNIASTTLNNQFAVKYQLATGEKTTLSNIAKTVVSGKSEISNNSGNYNRILATGSLNKPLYISADSAVCNASRTVSDQVKIRVKSTLTGDVVEVIGVETAPNSGLFHYELATTESTTANPNDQVLQTVKRDTVLVSLVNCLDASGTVTNTIDNVNTTVLIDPYGIVFDAKTGKPIAGAKVTLMDASGNPVGNNVAFNVDVETGKLIPIPATQLTNELGEFIYPQVIAGTYSLQVDTSTIPGATQYTFVSDKSVYSSFPGKAVNADWSYGGNFALNNGDPALNIDIPVDPVLATPTSPLFVKKTATHTSAELGDFEEYTVTVANRGTTLSQDVSIKDTLPRGFIYVAGTARVNGVKVNDPLGGKGPYLTLGLGNLDANKEAKIQYRVQIGPNALNGDGINRVRARDASGVESNEASAKIEVTPGVLMSDAFIVGKVFMDCNRNGMQDIGERGVPGIRLYMEDGSYVVTDREGKYDFYGVSAKTHVLKLDRSTLPGNAEMILLGNRNAGDAGSRFVDLKRGELHRADFAIADGAGTCTQPLIEQVETRQEKIEQQNINLEQVLRADLSLDPLRYSVGDVRSQPASGCISAQGVTANCNIELSKDQIKELRAVQIEPVKAPVLVDLEQALAEATNNQLAILNLKDGQTLPYAQTTIQVKGVAGASIELWVNGQQIDDKRIGKKAVLPDFQIAGFDYIGVDLKPGKNQIELRQLDAMGNLREQQKIQVIAPDQMSKLALNAPKQEAQANGSDVFSAVLKIVDHNGTLVASRTPITLDSTIGQIDLKDLDPSQPGIQVFVEGGTLLVPINAPSEAGAGTLNVTSGIYNANLPVRFLPALRPMIAAGIVEGAVSFEKFDPKQLSQVNRNDGFEEELNDLASSNGGKTNTTGRAALFLKGKVKGEYLLTLAYDSDKDKDQRLFRDIRPDEYYPVYGDAAAKGFDAQSTSKLYVRVDKGRSYALYGDYVTRTENDDGLSLGQYNRSLTGARTSIETDRSKITGFVAQTNATQITNEQRGLGITGPYSLGQVSSDDVLRNSEKVEVIVRDRNNPGLIISQRTLARFTDYEVDTFSNSIYLKEAVSSVDSDLNPVYLRITVEADQGGEEYTVGGVSGSVKVTHKVQVGGSYVKSNDPLTNEQLASVNTVIKLSERAKLVAEVARSENTIDPANSLSNINASTSVTGEQSGNAGRIELDYSINNIELRAYHNQADRGFYNTASPITAGRKESGIKAQARVEKLGLTRFEAIRTEDDANQGVRQGLSASVERALNRLMSLELGVRYYEETVSAASATSQQVTPYDGTTLRAKLNTVLPWEGSNAFLEYEQDVSNTDRRIFALGGNYQITQKTRLYARQEILSSINGLYELNDTQRRNTTVVGIDSNYSQDGSVFSEYRVRDGISAREAEAAIGTRNRWQVAKGIYANTSLEKVKAIAGTDNQSLDSTAASVGLEYLTNPDWKGVARLEMRWADQSDTLLNTLGLAYKLTDDVTLLTKNVFSQIDNKGDTTGDRVIDRFQVGAAYRDFDQNRFDALTKLEYRYENDETNLSSPYLRNVYILSNHANFHPNRKTTLSGQYAVKYVKADFEGIKSTGATQLLSGRAMYDINERWDAGINAGLLWSDASEGRRLLLGGEVGYLLAANLWLSAGYNFSGYKDKDLADSNTTIQGAYVRFRFKFDEDLLNFDHSNVNKSQEPDDAGH
ncbi:MAG: DUF11 domain-containing protein [Moraxellaceae bacterium]|nr:MAG: DUF11 domain-containing protein [Moraxellaceae bacterium]